MRAEYPDGASGGLLYLVVQPSGAKSLALRFRFDGISEKVTLGRLAERPGDGGVALAEGRKAAAEARQKIEQGINPAGTRRAERAEAERAAASREADSIERLAEQFVDLHAKRKTRPRSVENTERALRLIIAAWRGRSVDDIRRRDVIELLDQIVADRTANVADKTHQVGSKFFSWLVARDVISSSPWVGIERPVRYSARERTLSDDEIRRLWLACEAEGPEGQAIRLMLLTGCRRDEVFESLGRNSKRGKACGHCRDRGPRMERPMSCRCRRWPGACWPTSHDFPILISCSRPMGIASLAGSAD